MEDNLAKHLVYGTIRFNDFKAFGLQNTWVGEHKKEEDNRKELLVCKRGWM